MAKIDIKAQISIIADYDGHVSIKVYDTNASTEFLELTLTHEQFVKAAMCRLSNCEVESAVVRSLERIGKKMEMKKLEFELPAYSENATRARDQKARAKEGLPEATPDGWIADEYFGAQDSFFKKDGVEYARTTIRRYV